VTRWLIYVRPEALSVSSTESLSQATVNVWVDAVQEFANDVLAKLLTVATLSRSRPHEPISHDTGFGVRVELFGRLGLFPFPLFNQQPPNQLIDLFRVEEDYALVTHDPRLR
jgi:hypothetical protein